MRIMWRAWGLGALVTAGLILSNGAVCANEAPVVHVKAVVEDGSVRLQAEANAPFEYTTYRPSEGLYVVDLSGVSAGDPTGAHVITSDLVRGYRLVSYSSGSRPVVRVELLLSKSLQPRIERNGEQDLTLLVSRTPDAGSPSLPTPTVSSPAPSVAPAPSIVPASDKSSDAALMDGTASIREVNLAQNGQETQVSISGSSRLSYRTQRLSNPDRLVLDFSASQLKTSERHIASNLDPVREIRMAQFTPEISRVVIDLREPAPYHVADEGNVVTVSFAPAVDSGADKTSLPASAPAKTMTTKAQVPTRANGAAQAIDSKSAGVSAPAVILPVRLTEPASALARPATGAQNQEGATAIGAASTAAAAATNAATASDAPVPATQPAPASAVTAPSQALGSQGSQRYTGEPISVNLKDVDLRDFFRLIHEISGLNVVVDPSVHGTLTIVLDDVPWDQALDIVLRNNDLDKQLDGNVLRIATKDTMRKEAEENRDLAKAQAEAADTVTTTRVLSYAKATVLVPTLKKFLSSRGDIIADDRSNTLIIRDIPSTLPVLDNLIRQLDQKSQQVEIEARVVAANRSFSRDIGTQFGFAGANPSGSNIVSGSSEVGTSPVVRNFPPLPAPPVIVGTGGPTVTSGSIPLATNLGASAPTSGISYSFSSKNFALDMIITAAESKGVGKLLSKPKIITQNNQKATVKQGTKIPVQTVVNNTVSVQFVDAVLELDVTPQITADGTVYMDVTVENDQIDGSIPRVQGIPAIDTQSAETKVTVNDGATVVIGGIIVTQQTTQIEEVPVVGSIPLLGDLFKHTTVSSTSQELLFFLTPRILPS